jgi:hypothetical protein
MKWKPISNNVKSFQLIDEPEVVHIIKTCFVNKYMLVFEDAYEVNLGKVVFATKEEIAKYYKIQLD